MIAGNFLRSDYDTIEPEKFPIIKRKAYIIKRGNTVEGGVSIYVDANTGLIIGGQEFGI